MDGAQAYSGVVRVFKNLGAGDYPSDPSYVIDFTSDSDIWNPWNSSYELFSRKVEFGEDVAKSVSELAVKWACGFGSAPLEYDRRSPRKDAIGFVEDWHDGFSEKAKTAVSSSVSAFELARYSRRRFSSWYAELSVRIPGFSVTDRMQLVMIPGLRYVVQPAGFAVFQAH